MSPAELFSAMPGHSEPDWTQFASLELGGCMPDPCISGGVIGGVNVRDAGFFTVYGRLPDGRAIAIADAKEPRDAIAIAARLASRSGLPFGFASALAS